MSEYREKGWVEYKIKSPFNPKLVLVQPLNDSANPLGAFIVTVHELPGGKSACNVWSTETGLVERLLPERLVEGDPSADMLVGETNRFGFNLGKDVDKSPDPRYKMAIEALNVAAINFARQEELLGEMQATLRRLQGHGDKG